MSHLGFTPLNQAAKKIGTTGHRLRDLLIADRALVRDRTTGLLIPTSRAHGLILPLYGSVTTGSTTRHTCKLVVSQRGYRYCERLLSASHQERAA
jgi:hypothetical protein